MKKHQHQLIKTPAEVAKRLNDFACEVLATFVITGDANKDLHINEALGTLFACVDETICEIESVCA
jgi:hypothetical protein